MALPFIEGTDHVNYQSREIEFGSFKDDLNINGFIGNNVLKAFKITIDYTQSTLTLPKLKAAIG